MSFHKLLQKQIKKYIPEEFQNDERFVNFFSAINGSYQSFERDKELLNHAFGLSEKEYQVLYENLNKEYELKNLSIEKLKSAVKNIEKGSDSYFNFENDNLLDIVNYINLEIQIRKNTENYLNRTLKLLTTLLSNLNSGILVEDENRKILYTNKLFCSIFSIEAEPDQMTGIDCSNSAEQSKNLFTEPDKFVNRISEILHNKKPVFNDVLTLNDSRILERDYIPIYINNEYKGHLWDYRDITERKKAEAKLINITNLQEAILNGTDYSIIYTNNAGIIKSFNKGAEKMLEYSSTEIINKATPALFHKPEELHKKAIELSKELGYEIKPGFDVFTLKSKNNKVDTNEWTYITKTGKKLTVLLSVSSIKNSTNEIVGSLGIARDITEQKQVQEALKVSEEQYRNIVEKSTDIIYKTDGNGYFTYVNAATEFISGYKNSELINKHFSVLTRNDFTKKLNFLYTKQLKSNNTSSYFEFPIITKEGKEKWIGQSVQILNTNNKIEYTALGLDITEKKQFELKLIDTNKDLELLKTLINNTSDAIQVSKENGQLVYINNEASKRLGIPASEASNYNVKDFETIFKNDKVWYQHVMKVRTKGPLIIEGENVNKETNLTFPVEVTVRFLEINLVGYIIANSRDISERKLIEESIRKQKEKYQNIIANMNLGLLEVDLNDVIQYVNPSFEAISGFTESDLIGKRAADTLITEADAKLITDKATQRENGVSDMYEVLVKNKRGESRWWMISGAPNFDDSGKVIGSIGIHLDITESKQLELELELAKSKAEESSKAKEAFLANMSHEIRTPLNAIIGMIRELKKEQLSEKQIGFVNNTSIASQHLLSVLNNILDISKIEAGELQLENNDFNMQTILNDVKSILLTRCKEKDIYLKINNTKETNMVFVGDESRFRQIFLNLVGNAVKFTDLGGVTINYEVKDQNKGFQSLEIIVEDTGIGMDQNYLKNIFNKFSQEDASISRKHGGSGLGMAITKELIELMNGAIKVTSIKGKGTTVTMKFILPIGNPENLVKQTNSIDANNQKITNVLLVEDNEFNRIVAKNTLKTFNCHVTEAENGVEAIEKIKSGTNYDIILMDLQMPIMDGFECTKILRNELKIKIPIIALTANAFKSELEHCINIGMNACVTKPFEEQTLMETIFKLLNNTIKVESNIDSKEELNEQLYNINKLKEIFKNDNAQLQKMIAIFIEQSETSLKQINTSYLNSDLNDVYQIAHRIKPSIDSMGIISLKETIRFIEKEAKEKNNTPELATQIQYLTKILNQVILQLKTN